MKIAKKHLDNILFLDIETVPVVYQYNELSNEGKELWDIKSQTLSRFSNSPDGEDPVLMYDRKAGIFAEFAKVICISAAFLRIGDGYTLRVKSFAGDEEKTILSDFNRLLNKHFNNPRKDFLCGHNIKEFDVPFLCRRMVINEVEFPELLEISGKKPWELIHLLDTMQMWKFGDFKNYTSLRLLAYSLGLPSPKDDIDGSQVARVYYEHKDLNKIVAYCEKDVHTTVSVFLKMSGFDPSKLSIEKAG